MSDPAANQPPKRKLYRVHPDDEAEVKKSLEDLSEGRHVDVSPEELAEWEATGELPASVEKRFAALECGESQD